MQDFRLALRALRGTPVVAAVAVLSLALGIGASTAIFTLVDSLVLRTLPVAAPDRLVVLSTGPAATQSVFTYATFDRLRRQQPSTGAPVAGAAAADTPAASVCAYAASLLTIGDEPRPVLTQWIGGDYFATLGVPAFKGRTLAPADDVAGGGTEGPVAMISYRLWQARFNGAPDIIGQSIRVERLPVRIVGIAPPAFFGVEVGQAFDLFLPVAINPLVRPSIPYDAHTPWLRIMLRLAPGQSREAATMTLRAAQPAIRAAALPPGIDSTQFLSDAFVLTPAGHGTSSLRQRYQQPLVTLLALSGLVLLVACLNVAHLSLARGAMRRPELSLRLALGASRGRLVRLLLVESTLLAGLGAALGLLFAIWASRALVAQLSTADPLIVLDLPLDGRVLAFTVATAIATALVSGLVPAWRATDTTAMHALTTSSRTVGSPARRTFDLLLIGQVAVSLLLVIVAGLFVRTAQQLTRAPLGFDAAHLLTVMITAPTVPAAERNRFYHRLVDSVAAMPGVASAGGSLDAPLTRFSAGVRLSIAGATRAPGAAVSNSGSGSTTTSANASTGTATTTTTTTTNTGTGTATNTAAATATAATDTIVQMLDITPGWLAAYATPLRAGRDIDRRDRAGAEPVMLVNEAFARRLLPETRGTSDTTRASATPGTRLVGQIVTVTLDVPPTGKVSLGPKTIVGIVGDAVYSSIREPVPPTIYLPLAQQERPLFLSVFFMAVRPAVGSAASAATAASVESVASPAALIPRVTATLHAMHPDLRLTLRPASEQVRALLAQDRLVANLAAFGGTQALLLAMLGLYGVTAYAVSRRRTEVGVRIALGGTPAAVMRLILSRVLMLLAAGVTAGSGLAWWASTYIAPLLYGLRPYDPPTFITAAIALTVAGLLAGWLPARHAARVNPAEILRA